MCYRHTDKTCRIANSEFVHHVVSMCFDGTDGDEKLFGDFACRCFIEDVAKDFFLTPGKGRKILPILLYSFSLHPGQEGIGEVVTEKRAPAMYFADALL